MAAMTASTVRAAALRKRCFSLAKTCSIGFRSGEYLGKEEQFGARCSDRPANGFPLVAAKIIHHHEVASSKRGHKHLLDISFEAFAIDRTVEHKRRLDAIMPKGGHKGQGFPMAVRNFGHEPCAARRPSPERRHVRLRPRLICSSLYLILQTVPFRRWPVR